MFFVINNHLVVLDFNFLFWKGDDPFNVLIAGLGWGFKNDYIAPLGLFKFVGDFVGQNIFFIVEVGEHGVAVNLVDLGDEEEDDHKEGKGGGDDFDRV